MRKIFLTVLCLFTCIIVFSVSNADNFFKKAVKLQMEGKLEEAAEYYTKAIEANPQLYEAYSNRGLVYNDLGMYDKAIEDYNKVFDMGIEHPILYSNRGLVYFNKKMYEKAVDDLLKAVKLKEDYADAYNILGAVYAEMNMPEKAIENFKLAVKYNPEFSNAYNNLGLSYFNKKMYESAVIYFSKAISISPSILMFQENRADSYYFMGEFADSYNDYKSVIGKGADDLYIYFKYLLASFKISKSRYRKTLKNLQNIKSKFKNNEWEYKIACFLTGELSEIKLLENADNNEKKCEAYCYIGLNYLFNKDKENAENYFKKCIKTGVENFEEYKIVELELDNLK